jgi:hypothetical protein
MTEHEWLVATDPTPMLEFLRGRARERKLRLFACACCRRVWHLLPDDQSKKAVELAELFADSRPSSDALMAAWETAVRQKRRAAEQVNRLTWTAVEAAARVVKASPRKAAFSVSLISAIHPKVQADDSHLAALLREVFGNPVRPARIDPASLTWNDRTVVKLAQSIYDDRAFDRLPILADALEEAGCTDADILTHCRQGGEHVRGCWVVDLLIGKNGSL